MMRKFKGSNSNNNGVNGFLPNSLRIISSCLKTVSTNATTVASSVKSSLSSPPDHHKEQVTWAGFDKLELNSSVCKHVLLLGYQNGFQVLDVDDASNFNELVSRRDDGPVTFLQMQPIPLRSENQQGFRKSFPLMLVVGGDESNCTTQAQSRGHLSGLEKDKAESHAGNSVSCPRAVRFYSLRSHCYVHVLRFRSAVCMVRCSPRIVAVGLATQIYCFDALTLENKFSVLTYPVPQMGDQGKVGVNIGYGPMAVGPRWLAYASNDQLLVNIGRLSSQTLSPSPGASPSTSPVTGSTLVAHYAMESGKHLAAGIVNLGDKGYKTLSKYCQELLPDGSNSSQSLSSGSINGRSPLPETDNAGVVVVKDFISRAIICQFRAHSTPVSALCFDPSGTLLVTASVNGNSINIFRIMPSRSNFGSDSESFDSSSSYVHLYKFHRGIRAAIIQDICFSRYSQWVAVVSSKGTCHVFVLSPFGGNVGFQNLNSHGEQPSIVPVLTTPWWSASSCTSNLQPIFPPPAVTLSVVTRIKDSNSGLLNTVSSAAASVSGKVSVPSGALAAVFHNSLANTARQAQAAIKSLEHLLVYTPSGHVVQHEIHPSFGVESDGDLRPLPGSFMQFQDAELSINIHPVQWWDVCRRSNWPEKEDFSSDIVVHKQEASGYNPISVTYGPGLSQINATAARSNAGRVDSSLSQEKSHWYLSNAEVQYSFGRLPVWQKYKISFCLIGRPRVDDHANGEYEIEKLPVSHVEIRQKDLLPVFDHFPSRGLPLNDRGIPLGRYSNAFSLEPPHVKDKGPEETIICHSKPASCSSTESSDGGSSRRIESLLDLDHLNPEQSYIPCYQNSNEYCHERRLNPLGELSLLGTKLAARVADVRAMETKPPAVGAYDCQGALSSDTNFPNQLLELEAHSYNSSEDYDNASILAKVHDSVDQGMQVKETLCKILERTGSQNAAETATNVVVGCSMDLRLENFNKKEQEPMFAFSEDSKKSGVLEAQEVTKTACDSPLGSSSSSRKPNLHRKEEEEEEDMLAALCDFSGRSGESLKLAEGQKAIEAANSASSNDSTHDKEENMVGDVFPWFGGVSENLEPAGDHKVSEAASNAVNSSSINSNKDSLNDEEDDLFGTMFAVSEG